VKIPIKWQKQTKLLLIIDNPFLISIFSSPQKFQASQKLIAMSEKNIEKVRNIGIVAHIDAGKTTTTERILYYTGVIHRMGEVDDGTTVTDWMKQERERGITITSASVTCRWLDHRINIIDTPGHVDFTIEVERCLRVLDGAVVVFCAVGGVEPQSETVWRQADRYGISKVVFVNKMDRIGADFFNVCKEIKEKFSVTPVPITCPDGAGHNFSGVVDLIEWKHLLFDEESSGAKVISNILQPSLEKDCTPLRKSLLELIADADDEAMEQYLKEETISVERIKKVLRSLTIKNKIVPVLAGSALRKKGIQPLLDAIVNYLPSPSEVPAMIGYSPDGEKVEERKSDIKAPFSAYAFKIQDDAFANQLTYLRIYSGSLKTGSTVLNSTRNRKEKVGKLLLMHSNRREEIGGAVSGDIVATVGLRWTKTGDTLCDPAHPVVFEPIRFPEPVVFRAIEPKFKADESRLDEVLNRIAGEDPSFTFKIDEETGQRIICGMGELHLEVVVTRIMEDYKVEVHVGKPQVAYRETVTKTAISEDVFDRLFGGKQQYAKVKVEVSPAGRGEGVIFENLWNEPRLTPLMREALKESILESISSGVLAGYPVTDVKIKVIDGEFDESRTTDVALKVAGTGALRKALNDAGCILMEPVMSMEIIVPMESVGDVIGDFNARNGKIVNMETKGGTQIIQGTVPLRMAFGYANELRSLTQGRGVYTMQFLRFEPKG